MAQIDKNTVKAENQLDKEEIISFDYKENTGKRILFVGNSITLHAPKEDIGWSGNWGMAASSKDKDYVHMTEKMVLEKNSDAAFCVCQVSSWETVYKDGEKVLDTFKEARDFGADIILMRIVENCIRNDFDAEIFKKEYKKLISYLSGDKEPAVIITSGFWKHPGDEALEEVAKEIGADFICLGELGEREEMRADGLFEHKGVAHHPGDLGMQTIAELAFEKIEKYL